MGVREAVAAGILAFLMVATLIYVWAYFPPSGSEDDEPW